MSDNWVPTNGIAIIKNSYIASNPSELTVIVGDQIKVIEKTQNWYRGKNLYSKKEGIFPITCSKLYEGKDITQRNLLSKDEDILFIETAVTIRTALAFMSNASPDKVLQISNRIVDVITMFNLCQKSQTIQQIVSLHSSLATSVDNLRIELGYPKNNRTFFSSMTTLTTWGRDIFDDFMKKVTVTDSDPQYTLLHASVNIKMVKSQMIYRFFLYSPAKKSFLSCPVSILVSPERQDYELIFNQLDKHDLKTKTWLLVYSYVLLVHREGQFDERKFVACAAIEVPPCTEAESYGKSVTVEKQSNTSTNKSLYPNFHTYLTGESELTHSIEKTITHCAPYFTVKFTPYYGSTNEIVQGMELSECQIIPPYLLPSTISPHEKRSMLNLTLSNLKLEINHKKLRIITRIIDTTDGTFLRGFESIVMMSHDNVIWCSQIFGGKDSSVNETFAFDLSVTESPLISLFLIVQIDKKAFAENKFTPCAYGVFHLSSDVGNFTPKADDDILLYPFAPKNQVITPKDFELFPRKTQKVIGKLGIHFSLASTKITQDQTIYQLLHYKEYRALLSKSISTFMFSGISEWSKYAPSLTVTLCQIIATIPDHSLEAFNSLLIMFGELLSRAGSEYSNIMDEFIKSAFDTTHSNKEINNNILIKLADTMLPLITNAFEQDQYSQDYRNLIRTLPYLLQLVSRSYSMNPNEENKKKIANIFEKLNVIVSIKGDEDKFKNSCILANQRLLLQHFSVLIDLLSLCFDTEEASKIVCSFILAIRNDNQTIDKCKMQLLLKLSVNGFLNNGSNTELQMIFSQQLIDAFNKPHCVDYINQILTAFLYSSNNNFIPSFLTSLEQIETNKELSKLLTSIAYVYPSSLTISMIYKICNSEFISSILKLFILSYVCKQNKNFSKMYQKLPIQEKRNFLKLSLKLSLECDSSITKPLDEQIDYELYFSAIDTSIFATYFKTMSIDEQLDYSLIPTILKIFLNNNKSILSWYFIIIEADYKINKNINKTLEETLMTFWKLSKTIKFDSNIGKIFIQEIPSQYKKEFEIFEKIISSIYIIRNLPDTSNNQDEKCESLITIYEYCKSLNQNNKLLLRLLKRIIQLNIICKNNLELASTLINVLPLFKCDNTKLKKKFLDFEAENGRELHQEILFKVVEIYISNDFDEYGIPYLQQLIDTCVKPFQYIELMIKITELQAKIYSRISTASRSYPMYIKISFYGDGFSESFRNRSFIYMYKSSITPSSVTQEMKEKFPNASIDSEPPSAEDLKNPNLMSIVITPALVSSQEEIADIYYRPDFKHQKTAVNGNHPQIFKSEKTFINENSADTLTAFSVKQSFCKTGKSFPQMTRRIEVVDSFPEKILSSIEYNSMLISRKTYQLLLEKYWVEYQFKEQEKIPDDDFISKISGILKSQIQSYTNGTNSQLCKKFLDENYEKEHAEDKQKIEKLRSIILENFQSFFDSIQFLQKIEKGTAKEAYISAKALFEGMMETFQKYVLVTFDFNKTS